MQNKVSTDGNLGSDEVLYYIPIGILSISPQQVRLNKVHHTVVFPQVVLHGRAGEHDPAPRGHPAHGHGEDRAVVLEEVAFVTDYDVRAGV